MFQTFLGVLIIALSLALGFAQDEKFSPQVTYENVPYGNHPHQVIDFWKAEAKDPCRWLCLFTEAASGEALTIK